MEQLVYSMQLRGQVVPQPGSGDTLMLTAHGARGTVALLSEVPSGCALLAQETDAAVVCELTLTLTGETTFDQRGAISFAHGRHCIHIRSIGKGCFSLCAQPHAYHGTAMWRVTGGDGDFAGASGVITSNFIIHDSGDVTDYHLGVLFVREYSSAMGTIPSQSVLTTNDANHTSTAVGDEPRESGSAMGMEAVTCSTK